MFLVDQKIKEQSIFIERLSLCDLYLKPDSEVPWFILIPRIENTKEISNLEAHKRFELFEEVNFVAKKVLELNNIEKINIGSLGNIVAQLHVHVIGRSKKDRAWPGAIWGVQDHGEFDHSNTQQYQEMFAVKQNKVQKYEQVLKIAKSVLGQNNHYLSNMANLCTLLYENFHHHWTGFYINDQQTQKLILGPYTGPLACTEIAYGKGVCGSAYQENKNLIVADVHQFPGHIACSSHSNSEIVLPFKIKEKEISGVLDIDSIEIGNFDKIDEKYLSKLLELL